LVERKRNKDDGLVCPALAERKAKKEKETKTTVWFAPQWQREKRKKEKKQSSCEVYQRK
jgi:hypothetical protein